jgi:hypothetical protein
VYYGSVPHFLVQMGSGTTTYPTVPYGPRVSSIKKSLAVLHVQLDMYVPNAHAQVSKVSDMAYKTCGQTAQSMTARRAYRQLQ